LLLATTLENLWVSAADAVEGTRWIEALLAGAEPGSPLHALALRCLGNCAVVRGDVAEGIDLYRRSAEESRALGDELQIAITLSRVAMNELWRGDVEAALELNAEQLHVFQRLGFGRGEAQCLGLIAIARRRQGRLHEAHELLERAAALCRATGFTWWEQSALLHDTAVLLELGRAEDALRVGAQALAIGRRIDDRLAIIEALALAARGHALAGDTDLAARLWRGIDGEGERRPPPHWTQERQRLLQPLVEAAGPGFAAAVADGRATTLEEAVSDALAAVAAE
jgi:tetratricopeptide (TPR) repeat protein